MGLETIAFVALTAFKASSSLKAGKEQGKAIAQNATAQAQLAIDQGNFASKEKAKEIRAKAARQTSSFLNSGITLEGTPSTVIGETFSTGLEDLDQIKKNSETQANNIINSGRSGAKNAYSSGRNQAISDIVGGFSSFAAPSTFDAIGGQVTEKVAYGLNDMGYGNTAYTMLEAEDAKY